MIRVVGYGSIVMPGAVPERSISAALRQLRMGSVYIIANDNRGICPVAAVSARGSAAALPYAIDPYL